MKKEGRSSESHTLGNFQFLHVESRHDCLFECFNFALFNAQKPAQSIREAAAGIIEKEPDMFSDVILDCPRQKYLDMLTRGNQHGGHIDIVALCQAYKIRVVVVGVGNQAQVYGEEDNDEFIILAFRPSHYDLIAVEDSCCPQQYITRFFMSKNANLPAEAFKFYAENAKSSLLAGSKWRCMSCSLICNVHQRASHMQDTNHAVYMEV